MGYLGNVTGELSELVLESLLESIIFFMDFRMPSNTWLAGFVTSSKKQNMSCKLFFKVSTELKNPLFA